MGDETLEPLANNRARGRDLYGRLRPVIQVLTAMVGVMPKRARVRLVSFRANSDSLVSRLIRFVALSGAANECGELVDIHRHCDLLGIGQLNLGSRISIHPKCYIDATGGVWIGSDVSIAHHVTILSTTHSWKAVDGPIRDQPVVSLSTHIEDDVWIGAGARIMAGVTIGRRSIVGAGSVVTRDVPSGVIVAGVPARVIREI